MVLLNVVLSLLFLTIGVTNTFLMFRLWGYPYDQERHTSSAPPRLMRLHRLSGYAYLAIYVYLMVQMVPRLWTFQVELPARTVLHLTLGMTIGIILIIKIAIVRFFKHLESTLVPMLGTGMLIATFLLIGLSAPVGLREVQLSRQVGLGSELSVENRDRVARLIGEAGLPPEVPVAELATVDGLRAGRRVLLTQCVTCHDLRTVLVQPRTPSSWWRTVGRMADRSLLIDPIADEEQWRVTAYLIAISPELQSAAAKRRGAAVTVASGQQVADRVLSEASATPPRSDPAVAREAFESYCSLCHELSVVSEAPPATAAEARELIGRMVDNGLIVSSEEIEAIFQHLVETYP